MHCLPVGLVEGGKGLSMMWGREKARESLKKAGFGDVQITAIPQDIFNLALRFRLRQGGVLFVHFLIHHVDLDRFFDPMFFGFV